MGPLNGCDCQRDVRTDKAQIIQDLQTILRDYKLRGEIWRIGAMEHLLLRLRQVEREKKRGRK